jgi:hypothetical protein
MVQVPQDGIFFFEAPDVAIASASGVLEGFEGFDRAFLEIPNLINGGYASLAEGTDDLIAGKKGLSLANIQNEFPHEQVVLGPRINRQRRNPERINLLKGLTTVSTMLPGARGQQTHHRASLDLVRGPAYISRS